MDNPSTPKEQPAWYDGKFFKSCQAAMPFVRWGIIAAMFLSGVYMYQRDTNAAANVNLLDLQKGQESIKLDIIQRAATRDRQFDDVKKQMLTREVFEAYHESDKQRMERIEKMLEHPLR
jgi:hypothetical protein